MQSAIYSWRDSKGIWCLKNHTRQSTAKYLGKKNLFLFKQKSKAGKFRTETPTTTTNKTNKYARTPSHHRFVYFIALSKSTQKQIPKNIHRLTHAHQHIVERKNKKIKWNQEKKNSRRRKPHLWAWMRRGARHI